MMTTALTVGTIENEAAVVVNISETLVSDWLEYIKDKSAATRKTYAKAIGYFVNWLADNQIERPTRSDVIAYRDEICQSKKPATARLYTVAVKTFSRWVASTGTYLDFAAGVKAPSLDEEAETHSREALTLDEAKQVLSSFKGKTDEISLRNALIFRIMLNCGLRSVEIVRLDSTDIERRHGKIFLKVWGKGRKGKTARVEISKTVHNQILEYLIARGAKFKADEPMFVSTANRNRGERISTQVVSKMAKATFRKVGIDSEAIVCHSCRHFTCTQLLLEGVDIARCQRLLRHKSAQVTERYRHDLDRVADNSVLILSNLLDAA